MALLDGMMFLQLIEIAHYTQYQHIADEQP